MSFGWSLGDVIAGLKVVWDIWEAVSDGPLNAHFEASQFFNEFILVISRLEDWEKRKAACSTDNRLAASNQQLREQCTLFIKRHMNHMQQVNPQTKAIRQGRSTWLQRVTFTRAQVLSLYQHVSWPFERKEVERLREKLQFFLQLAIHDISIANHDIALSSHDIMKDLRDDFKSSNAELLSSNLKLVSSHLDLVSLVTLNLKRVTYPLEPGREAKEIDYPMLRHFEQALRPPQPLQAIEGPPSRVALPWRPRSPHENAEYAAVSPAAPYNRDAGPFDQNEIRGLISRRLDNMSMRIGRVDTMESIPESEARESISEATQPLLDRLRDMRDQIGNAVGIMNRPNMQGGAVTIEPENALRQELEAWNQLEERIEREILHPGRLLAQKSENPSRSEPIPIPPRKPSASSISPGSSPYEGWHGLPRQNPSSSGGSFRAYETSLSTSPSLSRPFSHNRTLSSSSSSPTPSLRLDHYLPVSICYTNHTVAVNAVIHSISRFEDGDVHSITSTSQDGTIEIRHSIDLRAPATTETSMKPFLDNGHVDKTHKLRVQFQGAHNIKITKKPDKITRLQSPPIYKFQNQKDFLEFQRLLLNKEVRHISDIKYIKSINDDTQCRQGTLRILLDPFSNSRYILYFRHTSDQKHGFVEWPVHLFKDPREPGKRSKTLTLESHDGKSLNLNKGLSRRSTQGSVTTIASFESSAGPAFGRLDKKGIRGLVIEFYEANECHDFWKEFRIKEVSFLPSPAGSTSGLGFAFPAELAATENPISRQNSGSIGIPSPNIVASPKADNGRHADGLLGRRNDAEYLQAPLPPLPNNDFYSELDSSVVAELESYSRPSELSATKSSRITNESSMTRPLEDGLQSPSYWAREAISHVRELRASHSAYYDNDDIGASLPDIIRDCIWPFYSNRLDKLLGPVDRLAEFERDDSGEVTSVTIYLLCTSQPSDAQRKTVEKHTLSLLPKCYQEQNRVNIEFAETEAMTSMACVYYEQDPSPALPLKMGDGIMSPGDIEPDTFETGSAGPWLTAPDGRTYLYTNEHVVRPGIKQDKRAVATQDKQNYIGTVIFTSADGVEKENNATMRSTNPNSIKGVANLTDWALIKLNYPAGLITMPGAENNRSCNHINGISHVPTSGYGSAIGAASGLADGQPWKTPFANEGVPYTIGKGRWYGNEEDLQCWTLGCPRGVDKMEWYHRGLGINGDSGTGVVDCETGNVCALVLGQVKSVVPGLFRRVLVIDMVDVRDDTARKINEARRSGMEKIPDATMDDVESSDTHVDEDEHQARRIPVDFEWAQIPKCGCGKGKGKGKENPNISLSSSLETGESSSRSENSESAEDEQETSSSVSSSRCHEEAFGIKRTYSF